MAPKAMAVVCITNKQFNRNIIKVYTLYVAGLIPPKLTTNKNKSLKPRDFSENLATDLL